MENENKSELQIIPGTPPDLVMPPKGCGFASRCKYCMGICKEKAPDFTQVSESHKPHAGFIIRWQRKYLE